ncbi:peptidoglycan-binding domain-containing protein [Longitalea luteola]|uniref:peptidoglycan-binding domain-containing protein n=1 Tax=Longitalea luteola TaxID=2812563 RepID=UPI001A97574E|nr:peptidoglycan-binding domain-containing protein [Longitalea luteola]
MKTKKKAKVKSKRKRVAAGKKTSRSASKKVVLASVAAGLGLLSFFGWKYFKRKKAATSSSDFDAILKMSNNLIEPPAVSLPAYTPSTPEPKTVYTYNNSTAETGGDFPLKKGSRGDNVLRLQQALIAKGHAITADGVFGPQTEAALKKAGFIPPIDKSTFHVIVSVTQVDASAVGKDLYNAARAKNYTAAISSLKKLKSTDDYAKASDVFKTFFLNGVRQTLVNGLLSTFSAATQKDVIKREFLRMGLQYDGSKWALSGLDGVSLLTTQPTTIWVNAKESVSVPAGMVLGSKVAQRLDYALFENKGKYFLVNTNAVKLLS